MLGVCRYREEWREVLGMSWDKFMARCACSRFWDFGFYLALNGVASGYRSCCHSASIR